MGDEWKVAVRGIIAIIFGALFIWFWQSMRPDDDPLTVYGVGVLLTLLFFALLHFIGKGE
ncbi:MAG: hypothetical protein QXD51_04365 [Candidatus Anstonellales archaeon]